ncbi:MAG: hypothetical protein HZC41_14165 [Chloroflexi bacterium]|nr:hypothetical protein [Chloroflexota bacterium]
MTNTAPRLVGIGAVFIDDIVLPTGQTYMGQLGGGVVHALMGAALWSERPGIVAVTGQGLPETARARLEQHLDTTGLRELPLPQMRAWQIFEDDGTRRELYRVREIEPFTQGAQPEHFPSEYQTSTGFYLLQGFDGIRAWLDVLPGLILWEPLQQVMLPGCRKQLREVLQTGRVDIVSPNRAEASAIYGNLSPDELLDMLFEDGANVVALRLGARGSLVGSRASGERVAVGTYPVKQIIDQTGAGNTYCGAFLLGMVQGKRLAEAGAMGAVAASFCIEHVGVLDVTQISVQERDQRLKYLLSNR